MTTQWVNGQRVETPDKSRVSVLARLSPEVLVAERDKIQMRNLTPERLALARDIDSALSAARARTRADDARQGGKLVPIHHAPSPENGWRGYTTYEGDPLAWMAPFMRPGITGRVDRDAGVERVETVRVLKKHGRVA